MFKPVVIMPSYNTGSCVLKATVLSALANTSSRVCLVIDGSDDGSEQALLELARSEARLEVIMKSDNEGKGAAVRSALEVLQVDGFTNALVMDADGQHPAEMISDFFEASERDPDAMVLGQPIFDADVPWERLYGRKLSVWCVRFEVWGNAIGDPLYGFRVYPIGKLLEVINSPGRSNRYDFDPEVAVRLNWAGVPSTHIEAPVKYLDAAEGGVSHFHYLRDNLRYVGLHVRLIIQAPFRLLKRACLLKGRTRS